MIFGDEKIGHGKTSFSFLIYTIYPDGMKWFMEILGEKNKKFDMNRQVFHFFFMQFTLVG